MKVNYHVHSNASDGNLTPEEVILEAIKLGFTHICFTDHYDLTKKYSAEEKSKIRDYFKIIKSLKNKFKNKLDISIGAEFDWDKDIIHLYEKEIKELDLDFIIGSVHWVSLENTKLGFWDDESVTRKKINIIGVRKYLETYYDNMSEMIKSGFFDCVAHFDIPKLNSPKFYEFPENEKWYQEKVKKVLGEIAKSKMCIEINMRGMAKQGIGKQYPSLWILREARKKNIPITIGNDFHNFKHGGFDDLIDKAYNLAREAGYTSILVFKNRKSLEIKI